MPDRVDVLWLSATLQSAEHCIVRPGSRHATVTSTTLLPYGDVPARLDYTIATSPLWETLEVSIELSAGEYRQTVSLDHTNDGWLVNGTPRADLDDCIDVDLGWTPATNMLPLRRAPINRLRSSLTTAAWVRFPELDVVPSDQKYTRLAGDRVRYQSSTLEAELIVTPDGLVTTYGDGLWEAAKLHRSR